MKKSYILTGIIVIALVLGLYFYTSASSADNIKVGAVLSLSGTTSSFYGEYNKRSIDMVVDKINSEGGLFGKKLEVVYEDSRGDKTAGVSALQKLIGTDIRAVITDISAIAAATAPIAEENKIVFLATSASTPILTTAGDYIFRTKLAAPVEGIEAARYLKEVVKPKSVAFLYQNSDYGNGVFSSFEKLFKENGINIVSEEKFNTGSTDMRTNLESIKAKKPDLIVVAAFPKEVGVILKQAREMRLGQKFFAHSGSVGPDIDSIAGEAAEGLMYLSELDRSSGEFKEFAEEYSKRYGQMPELFSSTAYDAMTLLTNSIRTCNGVDSTCIKNELYKVEGYLGVSGTISFDQNGDVRDRKMFCLAKKLEVDSSGNKKLAEVVCNS